MNKKILVLVFSLVLLASIFYMTNLISVKADSVVVVSSSAFIDSSGDYQIVGEVLNTGSGTVDNVQITANYYDSHNNLVDTQSDYALLNYMQPNAKSPFEITENAGTIVPQISTYTLQVSSESSSIIEQGLVIISNSSSTDSSGNFNIDGQIQNVGTVASSNNEVYVTCYNSSGTVVDVGTAYTDTDPIAPSSTSTFEISITDLSQVPLIASYFLTAQSSDYALVSANSVVSPTQTPLSTTTSTPVTPEFPPITVIALFMTMLLLSTITFAVRKRKIGKK
jgi:hypothetical protein